MLLGADDRKMWDTVSKRGHINALLYSGGDANTIYKNTLGFGTFRLCSCVYGLRACQKFPKKDVLGD